MRCRKPDNPFTKLGQDFFAIHWVRPYGPIITSGYPWSCVKVPWLPWATRYNLGVARVLMVASEAAPLAKTGGLADVVGSLPSALRLFGDEAAVVLPRYGSISLKNARRVYDRLPVHLGLAQYDASIYQAAAEYPLFLVDCPPLYERKGFYGVNGVDYPDNHIRFAVFARAALTVARALFQTEIFHCHDWQSGLVPAFLRTTFAG